MTTLTRLLTAGFPVTGDHNIPPLRVQAAEAVRIGVWVDIRNMETGTSWEAV